MRCHNDIGWAFSDEGAAQLGVNGGDHRRFLNELYRGRFPSSFARGLPCQETPKTGDCRISGTCASLTGLEKAMSEEGPQEVELAIQRILLIHGLILTMGGIPLLYLGEKVGTLYDYSFREDSAKARDSRWVHRPKADWACYARRTNHNTVEGRVYAGLQKLIVLLKEQAVFAGGGLEVIETGNEHLLGFVRTNEEMHAIILAIFSKTTQSLSDDLCQRLSSKIKNY